MGKFQFTWFNKLNESIGQVYKSDSIPRGFNLATGAINIFAKTRHFHTTVNNSRLYSTLKGFMRLTRHFHTSVNNSRLCSMLKGFVPLTRNFHTSVQNARLHSTLKGFMRLTKKNMLCLFFRYHMHLS